MKKIIGILGVTLILAVTFFNLSLITTVNSNTSLDSLIQTAKAQSEAGGCDYSDEYGGTWSDWHTYLDHNGRECTETWSGYEVVCQGSGSLCCWDEYVVTEVTTDCGGPQ